MMSLPQGATLHSLATFFHRSCGARNGAAGCIRYYGIAKYKLEPGNPFGQGAQHLATEFLGGVQSGAELIRRHTLIGLYKPVMCDEWWGNRSVDETARGASSLEVIGTKLIHKPLSWCPDCFREDFDQYGWAPWRVVHQVPFAHHCPVHGTALLSICERCNEPLGYNFRWRLPGDACRKCKGNSFRPAFIVEQSPGYQRLLRVLLSLNRAMMLGESMPKIKGFSSPAQWTELQGLCHSIDQLSAEWALSDKGVPLPKQLGVNERENFILFSMRSPSLASPLAILLLTSLLPQFD